MGEKQKAFRILVVGSARWIDGARLDSALSHHVSHHIFGRERAVTVACGEGLTGIERLCRNTVGRMTINLGPMLKLELRDKESLELPVGFDLVLAFPIEREDWEILHRANTLGVEVQIIPQGNR